MKKFSKLNESIDKSYHEWSAKDILNILKRIPGCRQVSYKGTVIIYHDESGDEIVNLEDIKEKGEVSWGMNSIKFDNEDIFRPLHTFIIEFIMPEACYFITKDGKEAFWCGESIPFHNSIEIFNNIDKGISDIKNDFYVYINPRRDNQNDEGNDEDPHTFFYNIKIEFIQKDGIEKDSL